MSPPPLDELTFLFLCLKHSSSNGTKIDFSALSQEYQQAHSDKVLSAEAARKRYLRLKARVEGTQIASDVKSPKRGVKREVGEEGEGRGRKRVVVEVGRGGEREG